MQSQASVETNRTCRQHDSKMCTVSSQWNSIFPTGNILFSPGRADPSRLWNVSPLADVVQTDALIRNPAPGKLIKLLMTFAVHLDTIQAAPVLWCAWRIPEVLEAISLWIIWLIDHHFLSIGLRVFCASLCTTCAFWCWNDSVFILNWQSPEHGTVKCLIYISAATRNLQTSRLVSVANANVAWCVGLYKKMSYISTKFEKVSYWKKKSNQLHGFPVVWPQGESKLVVMF